MSRALVAAPENAVAETFRWRDRYGTMHRLEDMETRHLFFTIRMIWNHCMPKEAHFPSFRRYIFGRWYTRQRMSTMVTLGLPLLLSRSDREDSWDADLRAMDEWLRRLRPALGVQLVLAPPPKSLEDAT